MQPIPQADQLIQRLLARGPARLLAGAAGPCYRTATQLQLRVDHAAAIDAVHREISLTNDLGQLVDTLALFEVASAAKDRPEYLLRPDLGRRLHPDSAAQLLSRCPLQPHLQIIVGDGLSATAVAIQVPTLLPLLMEKATSAGWKMGQPFLVRNCRVGILNQIGEILKPQIAILLIGERPGLATADSLSAYLAYQPANGHTDANRNLISNIHSQGLTISEATDRILALCAQMRAARLGGVSIKENLGDLPQRSRLTHHEA